MAYATSWRACFLNKARVCVYLNLAVEPVRDSM